jgi:hypothetical protein
MKLDKLFNVLVLGGAALGVTACGSDPDDKDKTDETDDSAAEDDQGDDGAGDGDQSGGDGADMSADGAGDDGASDDATGDDGRDDEVENVADASVPEDEDAGGTALTCSESPSPGDPCGCPCCWSGGLNTDDSCMSFCEAGNNGKGCCDV